MPNDKNKEDTTASPDSGKTQQETQQENPVNPVPQENNVISKEEHERILAKVRDDEKAKLYPEIEKAKSSANALENEIEKLREESKQRQQELEDLRSGKIKEGETINRELAELREKNQRIEKALETVASEAAERVRLSELASFRERKIRETGLKHLHDLVKGNSEEEIEASIAEVAKKENSIVLAAKEEARKDLAKTLPKPISPDGSKTPFSGMISPKKKSDIARLRGSEYEKVRAQLLAEAKTKAGLT